MWHIHMISHTLTLAFIRLTSHKNATVRSALVLRHAFRVAHVVLPLNRHHQRAFPIILAPHMRRMRKRLQEHRSVGRRGTEVYLQRSGTSRRRRNSRESVRSAGSE